MICHSQRSQLPQEIQEFYQKEFQEPASEQVLRFCRTQLMHAIWLAILDDEFMEAYVHGILIECGDGITRQVFPRFFTYSADYPEK